jgi:hypothetical protein
LIPVRLPTFATRFRPISCTTARSTTETLAPVSRAKSYGPLLPK